MSVTIIAKNQTAGDLALDRLSAPDRKIPGSGQVTLTDWNHVWEIKEDSQLRTYITNDQVLLNDGTGDLTKTESLNYVTPVVSRTDPDFSTTTDTGGGASNAGKLLALDGAGKADGRDIQLDGTNQDNHIADMNNPHNVTPGQITGNLTGEPTGFPNRTDSQISFTVVGPPVRSFTIQPLAPATSFDIYVKGVKYTKNSAETVQITDTAGLWYVYYVAGGTLTVSQTIFDFEEECPVAIIYWNTNAVPNKYILGEERHGLVMDWRNINYLHQTRGTAYQSGLDVSGYTLDTDSDAAVTIGVANGKLDDEDITLDIVHSATPSNPFEQVLQDPAQIPVYHRSGNPGLWVKDTATNFWFKNTGTGRVAWNQNVAGTWQQTEAANNEYVAYWIVGTNDIHAPIISVQGQRVDGNLANAKASNTLSSLDVGGLPFVEMRVLYRFILRTATGFAGTRKCKILDVLDLRQISGIPGGAFVPASHSALTGLGPPADDHPQYFNEYNAGEINALTSKASPVVADEILIEDSAVAYAKKKVTVGSLSAALKIMKVRNFPTCEQDRTYLKFNDATYTTACLIRFGGTTTEGIPTGAAVICSTSDTGNTGAFRIYDLTNSQVIAAVTGVTHAATNTPKIVSLSAPTNLPAAAAMWEIQVAKTAGGGEIRLHDTSIEF